MERDTDIGGPSHHFPATHHSAVLALRGSDEKRRAEARDEIVAAYWKPVYKYLRVRWKADNETAKDWTQGWFVSAFDRALFEKYDPARGTFRAWVRLSVDAFAQNERTAAGRLKRGGGVPILPLDFETAEGEIASHQVAEGVDPTVYFEREWIRSLYELSLADLAGRLSEAGQADRFRLFERYDLEGDDSVSYADLARVFGIPVTQVTNHLSAARREFRKILLERLRAVTADEEEFRAEARRILGTGA